jgi:hypothetical protein
VLKWGDENSSPVVYLPRGILRLISIPTRKLVQRILLTVVSAIALVYAADFVSVRVRMLHPKPGDPCETVTALRILAIAKKGGKTEYAVDQLQPQQTAECVHSLFPHNGDPPCWYLKRRFAQPIPMMIFTLSKRGG